MVKLAVLPQYVGTQIALATVEEYAQIVFAKIAG